MSQLGTHYLPQIVAAAISAATRWPSAFQCPTPSWVLAKPCRYARCLARVTAHRLGQVDDGNAVLPAPLVQARLGVKQIPDTQLTASGLADRFVGMDLHIAADRHHDEAGLMPGRFAGRFGQ